MRLFGRHIELLLHCLFDVLRINTWHQALQTKSLRRTHSLWIRFHPEFVNPYSLLDPDSLACNLKLQRLSIGSHVYSSHFPHDRAVSGVQEHGYIALCKSLGLIRAPHNPILYRKLLRNQVKGRKGPWATVLVYYMERLHYDCDLF